MKIGFALLDMAGSGVWQFFLVSRMMDYKTSSSVQAIAREKVL